MKKLTILLTILILLLCFGAKWSFAQKAEKEREFIIIELIIKKESFSQKIKVPISENLFSKDGRTFIEGEFMAGSWATVGCTDCPLISNYEIFAFAIPTSKDSAKVSLWVSFVNKPNCNIKGKEFVIKKDTNIEIKSKCGVKFIAHYDFEAEEIKNNEQRTTNN